MEALKDISEIDLFRHMTDEASRFQVGSRMHSRSLVVQRLMSKIQCLTDGEFETAISALESMVEGYNIRKKSDDKKSRNNSESQVASILRK